MNVSRIGRLLTETADVLASAQDPDNRWRAITRIAQKIGAEAVNIGGFTTNPKRVTWVRSTKDPLWLEEYNHAGFADVDPLVRGALAKNPPFMIDVAKVRGGENSQEKLREWRAVSMNYGYNYLVSNACYDGISGTGIALSCRYDPRSIFGSETVRAFSSISAMLTTSLVESSGDIYEGWAYGAECRSLLPEEYDVISYLANGLPEYLIADVLHINEFEVWRRIRNASLKLRATTKEQLVARAILRGIVSP